MMPLLRVQGVTKRFGGLLANNDICLDINEGEIHAVIGPNGAGKTTFMSQVSGELIPDDGRIEFCGRDVTGLPMPQRIAMGIGRCFQVTSVFLEMTAVDNVAIGVLARAGGHLQWWRNARSDASLYDPARALLRRVGLERRDRVEAGSLSHGERRQLEIAMALATEPKLLLLDEPIAGMGPQEARNILQLIQGLRPDKAVLLIEHDMDAVFELAQKISVLVNGRLIAHGTPDEIRADVRVQDAYLSVDRGARDDA
jgi:branched-chain amino acid transport system ATP-binding protein